MNNFILFFAQENPEAVPAPDQGFTQTLIMVGVALVCFYVILWRPEQKRRKAEQTKREGMKKGDRVTAMGIIGTISKVNPETVIVQMIDGAKIEFLKAAISDVAPVSSEEAKKLAQES